MNRAEIKQYLKDNLTIDIDETQEFGPVRKVTVKIELEGEVIAESCYYPRED